MKLTACGILYEFLHLYGHNSVLKTKNMFRLLWWMALNGKPEPSKVVRKDTFQRQLQDVLQKSFLEKIRKIHMKNTCEEITFWYSSMLVIGPQLYLKRTSLQLLSCEFWEFFQNAFSIEYPWMPASSACIGVSGKKCLSILRFSRKVIFHENTV